MLIERTGLPITIEKKNLDNPLEAKREEAEKVATEFETLFMDLVLKTMRESVKPEEESNAMGIYKGMLDSEYSKSMTEAQSFGIRDMIMDWMNSNDPVLAQNRLSGSNPVEVEKTESLHRGAKEALEKYKLQSMSLQAPRLSK